MSSPNIIGIYITANAFSINFTYLTHELKFDIQWNWTAFASVKAGFNFDLLKYNEILILSLISVSNFDEMNGFS